MTDINLEDIMNNMRKGDARSNIQEINLNENFPAKYDLYIGNILSQSSDISNKKFRINFDPIQQLMMRRMITNDFLNKRLIVAVDDFFKSMIGVDYYCSTIANSYDIIDELYDLAKRLEEREATLDPDMNDINTYTSQHFLRSSQTRNSDSLIRTSRRRYNSTAQEINSDKSILSGRSPVYYEAGKLIDDCIHELREYIFNAKSVQDFKALIFTDSLYTHVQDNRIKQGIIKQLDNGDYLKASIVAIQGAAKETYDSQFNDLIGDI